MKNIVLIGKLIRLLGQLKCQQKTLCFSFARTPSVLALLHFKAQAEIVTFRSKSFVFDPSGSHQLGETPNLRNEGSLIGR